MRTLARECFAKDWIDRKSRDMRTGNTFLEKCLHAFELLGRLQQEGLDFVFKGGTSLLLRLPEPRRLSIDIDIISRERPDRLARILQNCVATPFTALEEDTRRHNRPPRRRHWNFSYQSISPASCPDPFVILDVLEEDVLYTDVEEVPIQTGFITPDHNVRVKVPTVDNLLADKLTTFAPHTIGQEYSDMYPEKMAKHYFDIGELFDHAQNMHVIRDVYQRIAAAEIGYRKADKILTIQQCLEDTIETARLVSGLVVGQRSHPGNCALLRRGMDQLSGHLIGVQFGPRDASIAAAKAAYLASCIIYGNMQPIEHVRFDSARDEQALKTATITMFPELDKLKQVSLEAFYYWYKMEQYVKEAT